MRRARTRRHRRYPLSKLLKAQPKRLMKSPRYRELGELLHNSPRLKALAIPATAYRLLNTGRIAPEHLENLYRTYRLPRSRFFPLFLDLKGEYLRHQQLLAERRSAYIRERVLALPPEILRLLRNLGHFEKGVNRAGKTPVWEKLLYPKSKKSADAYHLRTMDEWLNSVEEFGRAIENRYPRRPNCNWRRFSALIILELLPEEYNGRSLAMQIDRDSIKEAFRRLSKAYHPDSGGDPASFRRLRWARDQLLGEE